MFWSKFSWFPVIKVVFYWGCLHWRLRGFPTYSLLFRADRRLEELKLRLTQPSLAGIGAELLAITWHEQIYSDIFIIINNYEMTFKMCSQCIIEMFPFLWQNFYCGLKWRFWILIEIMPNKSLETRWKIGARENRSIY